ncbi:hypothetical protein IFM89_034171 [Coptis chinensis]|uniref:Uncharacterized protein n=1 Tax=Coptis chinensis TaxID=261450 RepID=A0A835IG79_9MAGN|nr:hypothetical protein IFM89_034171 [Coptis chinensis]
MVAESIGMVLGVIFDWVLFNVKNGSFALEQNDLNASGILASTGALVREVKKESTSVACSFMVVLFEQGLDFGLFMNISLRRAESLSRVQAGIPLPTRKCYPVKSTFKRTKFHYLLMYVLKATKLIG